MVDHHARQRPAHRRTRELRARIGCCAHVLTPRMSTPLTPVAAHAHMHDKWGATRRGSCTGRLTTVSRTSPWTPAPSTPPILTSDPSHQHCTVWPNALAPHLQPKAIQARERSQIRAANDSIRHVEVFQMDGVAISIIERPRPLHNHDTPNAAHNTYTPNYEEPSNACWPGTSTHPTSRKKPCGS